MLIRSRARWIEQGEKPTKYFCHLENRNFVSKRINTLLTSGGAEINDFKMIKDKVHDFYQNLYKSHEMNIVDANLDDILDKDTKKLTDEQGHSLEGKITFLEAGTFLKNMKNNKSPGSTGFTTEFFKFFWKDLGIFLVESINYGFQQKEMSNTQKEGIITCIPKGNKSRKLLKNWRPISLLNVSYKIASGCIANRIKSVLPFIIQEDQSGFMSERSTADNIRLIYDILHLSKLQNKKGILLLIDFEKAFDSVSWSFISKVFRFFNFKSDILTWISTFYKNIKSTIIVNGSPTAWFKIERGCRQGDPISPYIFLLCGEILAHMIRQNKKIKGYSLFDIEIKINQFADDTSLFTDGSQESFKYCVETVLEYAKYSGLAMNPEKTNVVWFGTEKQPETIYLPYLNLNWNPKTFNILGVEFTHDLQNIADINVHKKLTEITTELNQWDKRDLTPFGKITVIKTLAVSKIVHLLIALPTPSEHLLNELNKIFYAFLWNGKPDKIKRSVAKLKLKDAGLGMLDIKMFDTKMKLSWIRKIYSKQSKWKSLLLSAIPDFSKIDSFGDLFIQKIQLQTKNPFWTDVLKYLNIFYKNFKYISKDEIIQSSFLFNTNIKVGNKVISDKILIEKEVLFINQLMSGQNFLTFQEFQMKYNINNMNFLRFRSIISSVGAYINTQQQGVYKKNNLFQPVFDTLISHGKNSSQIYNNMVNTDVTVTGLQKWKAQVEISNKIWKKTFTQMKYTTKDSKLHWLQYRINHHILTTNRSVSKYDKNQSELCTFCNRYSETIHHLFWTCNKVKSFWEDLSDTMNKRCTHSHNFHFTETLVLFGYSSIIKTDSVCDLIILMAKFYIYRCKVNQRVLNKNTFMQELFQRYSVQKYIEKNSIDFRNSWKPYLKIFQSLQSLH